MMLSFRARMTLWYVLALAAPLILTAIALLKMVTLNTQKRMDAALGVIAESEVERVESGLPVHTNCLNFRGRCAAALRYRTRFQPASAGRFG